MPLPLISMEGRVVADPELKYTASGVAMCKFRAVASSRKKITEDGEEKWVDDKNFWISVTCFRKLAENVAESIEKGNLVLIQGRLQTDEWETDGQKRTAPSILADNVAPSLLFTTVKAVAAERSKGGGDADPWATPPGDEPPF